MAPFRVTLVVLPLLTGCLPEKVGSTCGPGTHDEDGACVADSGGADGAEAGGGDGGDGGAGSGESGGSDGGGSNGDGTEGGSDGGDSDSGGSDSGSDSGGSEGGGSEGGSDSGGSGGDYDVCVDGSAPYSAIQDALDEADDGDTIVICPGTYAETLLITRAVALVGAGADQTVVDAGGAAPGVDVLTYGTVTLDGLTLQGADGGAVGAINSAAADLLLQDVRVTGNSATVTTIQLDGGSLNAQDTTIDANQGDDTAVLIAEDADITMQHVILWENTAPWDSTDGAFLIRHHGVGAMEIYNSVIRGGSERGVGIFTDADALFVDNVVLDLNGITTGISSGSYWDRYVDTDIMVLNSVFYAASTDTTGVAHNVTGALTVEYDLFYGMTTPICNGSCPTGVSGTGNLDDEPRFNDRDAGDYTLDGFSPCVDAGNPASAYNDPDGTRNDLGAYGGPDGAW